MPSDSPVDLEVELVHSLLEQPDIDPDTFHAIQAQLREIRGDLVYLQRADGYKRFLLDYLDSYGDGACGCSSFRCELKEGNLPGAVVASPKPLDSAIDEFVAAHQQPHALRDGRDAWGALVGDVQAALQECASAARQDDPDLLSHV